MVKRKARKEISGSPFSPSFATSLLRCQEEYREDPDNVVALECLRRARQEFAGICLATVPDRLQSLFSNGLSQVFKTLYESDMSYEALTAREAEFCEELTGYLKQELPGPGATTRILASMLYLRADQLPWRDNRDNVPLWLFPIFVRFLVDPPKFFRTQDEINGYRHHLSNTIDFFSSIIVNEHHRFSRNPLVAQDLIRVVLTTISIHTVYFYDGDLKDLYIARAKLLEQSLRHVGCTIDYQPAPRNALRKKIRVGILNAHFGPQTETYATIPVFEHLDREKFEVYLYFLEQSGHPIEDYCRKCADGYYHLTGDIPQQVNTLRSHDLDILFIGSNITAWSSPIALIALHRTARVQTTSICSPVTTGMNNIDYYIAGNLALEGEKSDSQYTEQLIPIDGSGFCFSFIAEKNMPECQFSRGKLGIQEDAVVFVSGANFFKIIPTLREAWADIISSVPNSVLLLYPFNPYWAGSYPAGRQLLEALREAFFQRDISDDRLIIQPPLPYRADIKELLKIADIYLDAFPYAGATSLIDALETGLPTVVTDGSYLRFRQAGALLRELGIEELVTNTKQAYCELATMLGNDASYRQHLHNKIVEKFLQKPAFLDAHAFSEKMGIVFEKIFSAENGSSINNYES